MQELPQGLGPAKPLCVISGQRVSGMHTSCHVLKQPAVCRGFQTMSSDMHDEDATSSGRCDVPGFRS